MTGSGSDLQSFEALADKTPLFVAHGFEALLDSLSARRLPDRVRLFSLCEAVEGLVRFVALVAVIDIARSQPDGRLPAELAQKVIPRLQHPTFGKWRGLLDDIVKERAGLRMMPGLPEAWKEMSKSLFAPARDNDQPPEKVDLIALRNGLAHGANVGEAYARELLETWMPRVAKAIEAFDWLGDLKLWTRDEEGFRQLTATNAKPPVSSPPGAVGDGLKDGETGLAREGHFLRLFPVSRWCEGRTSGSLAQQFITRGEVGLIYSLFGDDAAIQLQGDGTELDELDTLIDAAGFRKHQAEKSFQERGWDAEFAKEAMRLVGRGEQVDKVWEAVESVDRRGIVHVSGPAGIGKSTLVAFVTEQLRAEIKERRERSDNKKTDELLLAFRFIDQDARCAPLPFMRWLVERLGEALGKPGLDLRQKTAIDLRQQAISLLDGSELDRVVLVLDGLDELARREARFVRDTITRLAGQEKLLVLVSSRPEGDIPDLMREVGAQEVFPDGLPGMSAREIREMLTTLVPRIARGLVAGDGERDGGIENAFVSAIVERAQGLPLYVRLVVNETHNSDRTLDGFLSPSWLPAQLESFFEQIVASGPLSDRVALAPLAGCLLAIAREPLSASEIAALLYRSLSPEEKAALEEDAAMPGTGRMARLASEVLQTLGGLLRASSDGDGERRYRLLHTELADYVKTSPNLTIMRTRAVELLASQALLPGNDAASAYLYRHGIPHLLEGSQDREKAARLASALLADPDYQFERLAMVAKGGGDGGIIEDWVRIHEATSPTDKHERAWAKFWRTDGTILEPSPGGNGAEEFLELIGAYPPDTTIGEAADRLNERHPAEQAVDALGGRRPRLKWITRNRQLPQEEAVLRGHVGAVDGALVMPDGRILSWGDDCTLHFWNYDGQPLGESMHGHEVSVLGALVMPDGRILSWSCDTTLRLWSSEGQPIGEPMRGHEGWVTGALVMPDGRILSWSQDETLRLWTGDGQPIGEPMRGHEGWVKGALVMPDGRILSWSQDETLRLWTGDGQPIGEPIRGHEGPVSGALLMPDRCILSWSSDHTLRLWTSEGQPIGEPMRGHEGWVTGALVMPDGRILSWSQDETLRLWTGDGQPIGEPMRGHEVQVVGALVMPDGRILSWSFDESLRLWTSSGQPIGGPLRGHEHWVVGALVMPDGRILSWSHDGTLRFWIGEDPLGEPMFSLNDLIHNALVLPNNRILCWTYHGTLHLWSFDGQPIGQLPPLHEGRVNGALVMPDGRILSWAEDMTLRLWTSDGQQIGEPMRGHEGSVDGALVMPDGRILSWSRDETLRLWTSDGRQIGEPMRGHEDGVNGALIMPNGRILSWCIDENLFVWSSEGRPVSKPMRGHENSVRGALVMPNGRILSWSTDATLRLWSKDGQSIGEPLRGHEYSVDGALATPNGRILSWSSDQTLRLWSSDGQPIGEPMRGHVGWVLGATVMPNGHILSWSDDKDLRIWSSSGKTLAVSRHCYLRVLDVGHGQDNQKLVVFRGPSDLELAQFDWEGITGDGPSSGFQEERD